MKKAFSLIELLVVIAITAVLLAIALPNLLSTRERARDAKRKQEVNEMKNALRLYYNDWQHYPVSETSCGTGKINYIKGCGPTHDVCCPCDGTVDFGVGDCSTIYMKRFPSSFGSDPIAMIKYYSAGGDDFCLKVTLENIADPNIATSQTRCSSSCTSAGTTCTGSTYCVCAD